MEPFRALRPAMPLQYVYLLLTVVVKEGQTVTEYAEKAGVPQTVMTRHLLEIGDRSRDKEKGLGLVTQKADMNDLRKHSLGQVHHEQGHQRALQRAPQVMPKPQPPKDTG